MFYGRELYRVPRCIVAVLAACSFLAGCTSYRSEISRANMESRSLLHMKKAYPVFSSRAWYEYLDKSF